MTTQMAAEQLSQFSLFSLLTFEEAKIIAPFFQEVLIPAGTTFIQQDSVTAHLYLIVSGITEVKLPLIGPLGTTSIAKFGPGECVGELSLAKVVRRSASAVAEVECRCFVAETQVLIDAFERHPKIGYEVFRKLAEIITDRLVATNMMLRNSASQF